jgi:rod shape-determining protein MreD
VLKFLLLTSAVPVQIHLFSLLPFSFPLDLILIVTYYTGYFHGKSRGMMVGAYLGILTDVLSGELLGTQMFLKTLVGYFSALFGFGIFSKGFPAHFFLLVFFSLINGLMNLFIMDLFGRPLPFGEASMVMILPAAGWNAVAGTFFLLFVQKRVLEEEALSAKEGGG